MEELTEREKEATALTSQSQGKSTTLKRDRWLKLRPDYEEENPSVFPPDFYQTVATLPGKGYVCPACYTAPETGFFRQDVEVGHPAFGKLVKCNHPFHSNARRQRTAELSRLGEDDVLLRLSDIITTQYNGPMIEACRTVIERGYGWLYLHGGPGSAKTLALKIVVNEMNERGIPGQFTTMNQVILWMRAAFHKDATETELERYNKLIAVPVLAVDEVGWTKETDWLVEFRANFLNDRYERNIMNRRGITVFSSNSHPAELFSDTDIFGALLDRFDDGRCMIVENKQPSSRKTAEF